MYCLVRGFWMFTFTYGMERVPLNKVLARSAPCPAVELGFGNVCNDIHLQTSIQAGLIQHMAWSWAKQSLASLLSYRGGLMLIVCSRQPNYEQHWWDWLGSLASVIYIYIYIYIYIFKDVAFVVLPQVYQPGAPWATPQQGQLTLQVSRQLLASQDLGGDTAWVRWNSI